jgi:hypothetical protein
MELMFALYNIQEAIINAKGQNQSEQFKEIRHHIYGYWEGIVVALRRCHTFSLEVQRLQQSFRNTDKEQLVLLLEELLTSCERCRDEAIGLLSLHETSLKIYHNYEEEFKLTLRNATRSSRSRQKRSSNRPDGESSMNTFTTSFRTLKKEVENMTQFLDGQLLACQSYLSAARGQEEKMPLDEANRFANKWREYQGSTIKAIVEIQKNCDAVLVPAPNTVLKKPPVGCIIV